MKTSVHLLRASLLAALFHVAPRLANVLLFILIGRWAGPASAGVFSLATTYLLIFVTIMRGMDELVVREVSREPNRASYYLANFLPLRLILSLMAVVILVLILKVTDYPPLTQSVVLIVGLSIVPENLTYVAQATLLGLQRFGTSAKIAVGTSALKVVVGALALVLGGELSLAVAWLAVSFIGMVAMVSLALIKTGGLHLRAWLNFTPLQNSWRSLIPFMILSIVAVLESQSDTIILSLFRNESEVGWYSAATTIVFSFLVISQAYRFAVYPTMTRYKLNSPDRVPLLYRESMRYLAILVFPVVAGILILAPEIIDFLFGPKFIPAVPSLQILVPSLIFVFLNEPGIRLLLVNDRQKQVLLFLLLSAITNVLINLWLVPSIGPNGSASARVISSAVYFGLSFYYIRKNFVCTNLISVSFKPVLSTIWMTGILYIVRPMPLFGSAFMGAVAYTVFMFFIGGITWNDVMFLRNALTTRG
jgi:O-antigen/teichoic acid export membrane protein